MGTIREMPGNVTHDVISGYVYVKVSKNRAYKRRNFIPETVSVDFDEDGEITGYEIQLENNLPDTERLTEEEKEDEKYERIPHLRAKAMSPDRMVTRTTLVRKYKRQDGKNEPENARARARYHSDPVFREKMKARSRAYAAKERSRKDEEAARLSALRTRAGEGPDGSQPKLEHAEGGAGTRHQSGGPIPSVREG